MKMHGLANFKFKDIRTLPQPFHMHGNMRDRASV